MSINIYHIKSKLYCSGLKNRLNSKFKLIIETQDISISKLYSNIKQQCYTLVYNHKNNFKN